ncbi:polysaccharide deacetylase family protein [Hoyosella sp. YIM 151337]|uniref:polysaccharide deacetylase family protein n=1 Tax=Hoyosella sp. YIM 151337 TaxID=2992742 RepID=UPI002236A4E6|nr:polysaccharide deacetylase family protein [Hoyosella sp. YIM 151337]MCW4352949.1 polysaccharide deacetylase family protein [Hoyosella sp. YIM 151337]
MPTDRRVVALTFDAGASGAGLQRILDVLAAENVRATFFPTGAFAAANPAGIASISNQGHRLGNHSQTHPYFTSLSDTQIRAEIATAEQSIASAGGNPKPFFRFPFGDRDARSIAAVNGAGYLAVRWTVDTLGWQGTSGGRSIQTVVDRVQTTAQPGQIVLMHVGAHPSDGSTLDADALPQIITWLRGQGYGFVTLDELLW